MGTGHYTYNFREKFFSNLEVITILWQGCVCTPPFSVPGEKVVGNIYAYKLPNTDPVITM
jgi:hypothetical protein